MTKKQNAAGKKAYKNISGWTQARKYYKKNTTTKLTLQILAATPFVTQSLIDIVCFVVVLLLPRSQAVTKAREEVSLPMGRERWIGLAAYPRSSSITKCETHIHWDLQSMSCLWRTSTCLGASLVLLHW